MNSEVKFSTRFVAYLLDILLVYIVVGLLLNIRIINPTYDEYIEEYEKYDEIISDVDDVLSTDIIDKVKDSYFNLSKYGVSYNIATALVLVLYFGVFQKYNNGQTLGKKIMKIKVVDNNTLENATLGKYILRCLPLQFVYVGAVLPLLLSSILVFLLNSTTYLYCYGLTISLFGIFNIISFFYIVFRKDKRGLHDIISNTRVINE